MSCRLPFLARSFAPSPEKVDSVVTKKNHAEAGVGRISSTPGAHSSRIWSFCNRHFRTGLLVPITNFSRFNTDEVGFALSDQSQVLK